MFSEKNILLADDHSVVRRGVSLVVRDALPGVIVHHAESCEDLLKLAATQNIDLLVLDINLPGGNSPAMIAKIKDAHPKIKILIFSAFDEDQYALRYLHAGADGYLNKLTSEENIVEAVKTILNGERYISSKIKNKILENTLTNTPHNPLEMLSNREMEILELLAQGEGNLEVANKLNIQMSTVSTYKTRIFEKLQVSNIVSMVEKYKLYKG